MNDLLQYRFAQDDDCHWYLILAEDFDEFNRWVEAGPYWDDYAGPDFTDDRCEHPSQYVIDYPRSVNSE